MAGIKRSTVDMAAKVYFTCEGEKNKLKSKIMEAVTETDTDKAIEELSDIFNDLDEMFRIMDVLVEDHVLFSNRDKRNRIVKLLD